MKTDIDDVLNKAKLIFEEVESVLSEHNDDTCYKVPSLIKVLAVKLDWSEKQSRQNDQLIRFFLRDHSEYFITQGAKGGIQRKAVKAKKEQDKLLKDKLKEELKQIVEDKVASKAS